MTAAPVTNRNVVTDESNESVVGSVLWILTPVSPVTPLTFMDAVFPAGGTMVHATTVLPPVGRVIVLSPLARVLISIEPGEAVLLAAEMVSVPTVSPVYTIVVVLVAVTAIHHIQNYIQKSSAISLSIDLGELGSLSLSTLSILRILKIVALVSASK